MWEYNPSYKGGFHIWPEGMADPTRPALSQELEETWPESVVDEPAGEVAVSVGQ